ncbi:MAG TPA: DNA-binding response regulator, partial [Balneola sp.]|nr:DNA-binding response regulator [Balneola sp.]
MDNAFQKLDAITESIIEKHSVTISREMLSEKKYKDRFLVKLGRRLIPINASEIAYFQAEEKMVFLVLKKGKRYIINYTLSELEELMNPREFFRLN